MIKILAKAFCLLIIVMAVSCESNRIDSPRQLLAKEQNRLNLFLDSIPEKDNPQGLNIKDLWTSMAVDTIDNSLRGGITYFEMETGTGDMVSHGREVGYKLRSVSILDDDNGIPHAYVGTNIVEIENLDYVGPNYIEYDATNASGLSEAIGYMRKNGKSRVIIPSTAGNSSSFVTVIYDLEVTYLSE